LTLAERAQIAGSWIALERYDPVTMPLRMIEAFGDSPANCARQLMARGLPAGKFEFIPITPS
jgi:hypothetical protein